MSTFIAYIILAFIGVSIIVFAYSVHVVAGAMISLLFMSLIFE